MRQNTQAHALIGKRIDDTRHDLGKRIDATGRRIDDLRADNREIHNDLRAILQAFVRPPAGR